MKTQTIVLVTLLMCGGCTNSAPLNSLDNEASSSKKAETATTQQGNAMTDHNEEFDDPMPRLFSQLAACPISEISGVVDASGPGASGGDLDDDLWSFGFGLAAWRVDGKEIQHDKLYVRRKVTDEELDVLMKQIEADTVVRIQARIARENVLGSPQAILERFLEVDSSDSELQECLRALQEPATFTDDFFGKFTHERSVDVYAASTTWMHTPIQLRLWFIEGDVKDALEAAHLLWEDQAGWDTRVRDCAAEELLPLKSANWREEDGSSVSREQFEERIRLRSITLEPNGRFEMRYDDDELFFGHDIVVYGNVHSGMKGATIEG